VDLNATVRRRTVPGLAKRPNVLIPSTRVEQRMASEQAASDPEHLNELIESSASCTAALSPFAWLRTSKPASTNCCPRIGLTPGGLILPVGDYSGRLADAHRLARILLQGTLTAAA